jgi:hypothetical protein
MQLVLSLTMKIFKVMIRCKKKMKERKNVLLLKKQTQFCVLFRTVSRHLLADTNSLQRVQKTECLAHFWLECDEVLQAHIFGRSDWDHEEHSSM